MSKSLSLSRERLFYPYGRRKKEGKEDENTTTQSHKHARA
jgi:hypothetical protein